MRLLSVRYALCVAGILAAFLTARYLWLSNGTPPGQPLLTSLTENNLDQFKNDFNSAGNEARLVLLLSPT